MGQATMIRTTLLALLICTGSACRSTEPALHDLYRGALEELAGPKGVSRKSRERNARRFESVRKQLASERVVSAEDHLFAAGTLSTSDEMADLELARELAARASDLGEPLGKIFVAGDSADHVAACKETDPAKHALFRDSAASVEQVADAQHEFVVGPRR